MGLILAIEYDVGRNIEKNFRFYFMTYHKPFCGTFLTPETIEAVDVKRFVGKIYKIYKFRESTLSHEFIEITSEYEVKSVSEDVIKSFRDL